MNNKKLREVVGRQPLFFKPNTAFVKWLIKYAGDRIILDIGCGEDFMLTMQLVSNGYTKIVAIDPQLDAIKFMNWKHTLISKNISVHGMDNRIENLSSLYGDKMHQKVLMIFCKAMSFRFC